MCQINFPCRKWDYAYPDVNPIVWMKLNKVVEKFGERSCGFCKDVIDTALLKPIESDNNTTHTYGWLPQKINPINNAAGAKCAVVI